MLDETPAARLYGPDPLYVQRAPGVEDYYIIDTAYLVPSHFQASMVLTSFLTARDAVQI